MTNQRNDRRAQTRHIVYEVATLQVEGDDAALRGVLCDVGLGGAQIRLREPLVPGTVFVLAVGRDRETPLRIKSVVRYCRECDDSRAFAAGLEFLPQSEFDQMEVARYVRKTANRYLRSLAKPQLQVLKAK